MKKAYLLAVVLFVCSMSYAQSTYTIVAHRGAMGYEMENSIQSFQKALDLGAPMIELDVFVLPSGELVVFHDDQLGRLTNAKGAIESYTYKELKEQVQLNDGQSIPLLSEVLDLCASKTKINIELKGSSTAEPVNLLLNTYFEKGLLKTSDIVISSFKWEELEQMRGFNDNIAIGILTETNPLKAMDIAQRLNAISINPYYKSLTKEIVHKIHDAGFQVYTWTVNEVEDLQRLKDWGVDGVFCNYPDRGKQIN